jgi:hypothetical protein
LLLLLLSLVVVFCSTRQKIRWDDEFLYIGAELEEPMVRPPSCIYLYIVDLSYSLWCCMRLSHCARLFCFVLFVFVVCVQVWANNTKHQSVIFSDNDYEIFISPDGSNHYYKVRSSGNLLTDQIDSNATAAVLSRSSPCNFTKSDFKRT